MYRRKLRLKSMNPLNSFLHEQRTFQSQKQDLNKLPRLTGSTMTFPSDQQRLESFTAQVGLYVGLEDQLIHLMLFSILNSCLVEEMHWDAFAQRV